MSDSKTDAGGVSLLDAERHPGPYSGPDAEFARAIAMAVIPWYGNDDAATHQRIMKNGVWNDHIAVQAALAAIHTIRRAGLLGSTPVRCDGEAVAETVQRVKEACAQVADRFAGKVAPPNDGATPPSGLYRMACDIARAIRALIPAALTSPPPSGNEPQTLCGMIAAIYGNLDVEDSAMVDREWAQMRGYILPEGGPLSQLPATDEAGREAENIAKLSNYVQHHVTCTIFDKLKQTCDCGLQQILSPTPAVKP